MKVCVILNVLDPFKGGNHLPLFAACKSTEFTVVCNRSKCEAQDLPGNVNVIEVPGRIGPYYYGVADFLFAKLLLKQYPPTCDFWKQFSVIHINQTMGPALKKLKASGVPLLFLIHHPVTADRDVSGWWLKYAMLVQFQRKLCHAAMHIATVSQTMQQRIAKDYNVPTEKISIVPNGVDGNVFPLVSDASCEADVVAVGSFMHPRKGFLDLLKVYKTLAASGKNIADVGRRSDAQREALSAIDEVTVHGMVSGEKLIHLVSHSRVLVSTSKFEGFGLSLIEALASGHPAFAFSVGAVPEVLTSIDPQLVVEPFDTSDMCQRIEQYLALSPTERDQKGISYRNAVLDLYSLEHAASALEALYSDITA